MNVCLARVFILLSPKKLPFDILLTLKVIMDMGVPEQCSGWP